MIVVDTSALVAFAHAGEHDHEAVAGVITSTSEILTVSPFVLAEIDYLVATRWGVEHELAMLRELANGAYDIAPFGLDDLRRAQEVVARYRDQDIGLADASLVVLADRYDTKTILTLDRRHFEVLRPLRGGRFKILP